MDMNIVEKIIYGDIHETPLKTLGGHYRENMLYDDEQMLRLHVAATVKEMTDKIELVINDANEKNNLKRDLTDHSINASALKSVRRIINKQ